MFVNYIIIIALMAAVIAGLFFYVKHIDKAPEEDEEDNPFTEEHMVAGVSKVFAMQLKQNLKEMNLSRKELELLNKNKASLRFSLKEAAYGNRGAKNFIKDYIRDIIRTNKEFGINEQTVNNVIPFNDPIKLKTKDKFEIVLYLYNKENKENGFTMMIDDYKINQPHYSKEGEYFEITDEDVDRIYKDMMQSVILTYEDKLEILSQRIFEQYKGFGAVDMLFDSVIDEIDCGVSGIPKDSYDIRGIMKNMKNMEYSYESIWIVYHGVNIKMSCMSLGSQNELVRVCQNIYKFNAPESLSRRNGAVVSTMKDGSRILVVRPPFADSWAFFARKFDSTPSIAPEALFNDEGSWQVILALKWIVMTQCNFLITGDQGCGKTTTLKSILRFIPRYLTLRIQEKAFEMNLRYVYPERSIVTFQETATISMQEGLNYQKKSNGSVNVFGEIASAEASGEYLQTCRVASLQGIGTHHGKTVRDVIRAFAIDGETEETVSQTINFDVHMNNAAGHRYCQRITEIIPIRDRRYPSEITPGMNVEEDLKIDTIEYQKRMTDRQVFKENDIVVYDHGKYVFKNMFSEEMMEIMRRKLSSKYIPEFEKDMAALLSGVKPEPTKIEDIA